MKLRLHEIELGANNPLDSKIFYETIGIHGSIKNESLAVMHSNAQGVDLNFSTHFPPQKCCISFLTDDLDEIIKRLTESKIAFTPPQASHLGMLSISFEDVDGNLVKVNMPTNESPDWLKV